MKDLGNGKFQFEVSKGKDGTGKRDKAYKTVTVKGKTPEQILENAKQELAKFVRDIEKDDYSKPTHYTFASYVDEWKKGAERKLAVKTYFRYCELLKLHIIPQIGQHRLESINPIIIESAYEEMRKPCKRVITKKDGTKKETEYTLSESTIKHCHRLISAIMQSAYKKGLVRENPVVRVDAPKSESHEQNIYDDEQIQTLIEALEDADLQFRVIIHIALSTGAREGEITGLEWRDIDFVRKTIEIRQSAQYLPGKGIFLKQPKTKSSKRVIGLDDYVLGLIAQLQHEQKIRKVKLGTKWQGGNLGDDSEEDKENSKPNMLFIQADGSQIFPYTPVKQLQKFLAEKGLPPLRFHDLRHPYVKPTPKNKNYKFLIKSVFL